MKTSEMELHTPLGVVSTSGDLTGFTAGLPWKRALLELEGVPLCNDQVLSFSLV